MMQLHPNIRAFLRMVKHSEIGPALLAVSDDGYNVMVGSTAEKPLLFTDYSHHPRIHNDAMNSDAAGAYQFMGRYWPAYKVQLNLPDFGPESQDKWAVQLLRECHAIDDIITGNFRIAVRKCASRWASLPGAGYGQHENDIAALEGAYIDAGGNLA